MDHSVKAVFTDIDGTLLNSMHRVTPRTREQVLRIIRKGIPFVIVSARSPSGIYPIMRRNGFSCALISYSGALIMDPDRKVLYSKEIRRETAARIERYFAGKKYDKMAAAKDQSYYFVFVHEDGAGLSRLPELFGDKKIEASIDEIYTLEEVNKALEKVASGGSKGKTILRIS